MQVHMTKMDGQLREMGLPELRSLMDDSSIETFFNQRCSLVHERRKLLLEIKKVNAGLARTNVKEMSELDALEAEVGRLREVVKERQQSLQPLVDEVRETQKKDSVAGITERLGKEIGEMERQTRAVVEGAVQGGEWEGSLQGFVEAREKLHLKQQIFERLHQNQR